jgi:hypothetical protein
MTEKQCANCDQLSEASPDGLFVSRLTSTLLNELEDEGCELELFDFRNLCINCAHLLFKSTWEFRADLYLHGLPWGEHTHWLDFGNDALEWWLEFGFEHNGLNVFNDNIPLLNQARLRGITATQFKLWKTYVPNPYEWLDQIQGWNEWGILSPQDLQIDEKRNLYDNPFELEYPPPIELKKNFDLSLLEVASWWENGFESDGESPYELIPIFLKRNIVATTASNFFQGLQGMFESDSEIQNPLTVDAFLKVLEEHSVQLTASFMTGWWVFVTTFLEGSIDEFSELASRAFNKYGYLTIDGIIELLAEAES